jgi:hypothetical protein
MPGVNEAVYAAVAADHAAHCSADALMGAVTDPDELRRLVTASAKAKDVPDLSAFGYGAPRGRICAINGVEFLHLVYYNPAQPPLSVFMRPRATRPANERLTAVYRDRFSVASVSRSGVDLLIVSSLDGQQTSAVAEAIAARL